MTDKIDLVVGILGGGQLGKMLCQAGSKLAIDFKVMDKDKTFPCASICSSFIEGDINNFEDVLDFGQKVDILTVEIENVNIKALEKLEEKNLKVYPPTSALKIIRDKGLQKMFFESHKIPTSDFELFADKESIIAAYENKILTLPFVQKSRKDGYDGRGVFIVRDQADFVNIMDTLSVIETLVDIKKEISVIVARNVGGDIVVYDPVEMEFHPTANLVEYIFAPSSLSQAQIEECKDLAVRLAELLEIVGLLAVEMFLTEDGRLIVNEMAPRPHNSGHHTIESYNISQYEAHLRAIMNLPLLTPVIQSPSVVVNLLGEDGYMGKTRYQGLDEVLRIDGVHLHLYGKKETKPFRKMGHVTIVNSNLEKAKENARFVKKHLKVISQ